MTRDEIPNMHAGREMDALIAENVTRMSTEHLPVVYEEGNTSDGKDGWCGFVCPMCRRPSDMLDEPCTQPYSTDISAAWEVVEKIRFMVGQGFDLCTSVGGWMANFGGGVIGYGETPSLAICRAAMLAVMEDK